ncbi:3D domain-containing protein [Oceanobacillus bengalensis]|uniref:Uncharacterized protein n=1 Tax=Oceanobacillus bengalensis TaxID=1435466 RepID=A0A494YZC6_9BACI|nr:3D domain-containing protein [Oceanobacillus bengalensis]RKQ15589.1 hypothetical protein D8M05_09985 [Oceanobacillus bengalensis]
MKKTVVVMMIFTIILGSISFGIPTSAETSTNLDSIQNERAGIKENLSKAESEVSDILIEIENYNVEIDRLNEELAANEALVADTEKDIEDTISDVKRLGEEIVALENAIAERYDILKSRVVSYQQSGGSINYLEVIFGANSFGEFISRVSAVNRIAEADANLMEKQEEDKKKVQENQTIVMDNLDELNGLKQQLDDTSALIKEQKAKNTQQKAALKNKEEELTTRIASLEMEDSKLSRLEADAKATIEAEEKKAREKEKQTELVQLSKIEKKDTPKTEKKEEGPVVKDSEKGTTFSVVSTAYTVDSAGGSGRTYTGINLIKNPNAKVIAVDPKVIPLGSVVHVEGYGYAVAGDIGSAIKGKKIDVFVPTAKEAANWGVRTVNVTIW